MLTEFYFGAVPDEAHPAADREGLQRLVSELGEIDARKLSTFALGDLETGEVVVRVGRYGTYVEDAEGRRANVADELPPDELTLDLARELLSKPMGEERELGLDPETQRMIVAKNGRFGPYVTEVLAEDAPKSAKPRTGSLFQSMTVDAVTLEQALQLMSLPRVVGVGADGVEITAQNGRYGPYLKKGTDSRSLEGEDQIFDITLEQAEAIYAQPKQRGRAAAKPPLKELGDDPVSGRPDGDQGRPLRRLRDRRRGERHPAPRRRPGDHHRGAGRRAAGRQARQGSGPEEARRAEGPRRQEGPGQEGPGEEGPGEDGGGQDGGRENRRRRRSAPDTRVRPVAKGKHGKPSKRSGASSGPGRKKGKVPVKSKQPRRPRPAAAPPEDELSRSDGQRLYDMPYSSPAPRLINPELGLHNLVARAGEHAAYSIDVTLLDAPDHRLMRTGVLLAHRVVDGRGEWFLTAPEWQPLLPKDRIELMGDAELPEEFAYLLRPLRRRATLGPVAALTCDRREFALRDDQGVTLALLRDDKVTVRRGGLTTARYREVLITPVGPGLNEAQLAWLDRAFAQSGANRFAKFPRLVSRLGAPATGPDRHSPAAGVRPERAVQTLRLAVAGAAAAPDRRGRPGRPDRGPAGPGAARRPGHAAPPRAQGPVPGAGLGLAGGPLRRAGLDRPRHESGGQRSRTRT